MTLEESRALVDAAVLRHRADPTDANRELLITEGRRHAALFMSEQVIDFQARTH